MTQYYTLTKNNNIVQGPICWNCSTFQKTLYDDGVSVSLPIAEPSSKITLKNGYVIYPTTMAIDNLAVDEKLNNGTFAIKNNIATYTQVATKLSANEIETKLYNLKIELISKLSHKRSTIEQGGVTVVLNGTTYIFDSDRDSQGMLHRTFTFMQEPVNWKCKDNVTWVELDKTAMTVVVGTLLTWINDCFIKEATIQSEISSLDIFGAAIFNIEAAWSAT